MLNQAAARFEANKAAADASQPYSRTPLVNNAIRQLSSYTLADLRTATTAKLQSPWEDDKLIEHTNVILYHSVVTMVLDKAGNPFDLRYTPDRRGLLDYAVLVPELGSQMRRALPNPGGVTVSVQRYGDTTFRIENDKISKVLFGGVGSFREVGYGYTGKHALQETVEQFLKGAGGYIASVSAEAAFNPAEADLSRINLRLYDLAEAATPHVINEMKARLKNVVENWQEILEQGVWEAIKNVVIDEIRDRIQKYVIKKIGESIVPVVNAAFALYDLATGSAARTRMRYAIACAILAVKGTTEEDTELAARVVSKVVADEFEDKIIEALINAAKHVGKKVVRRATGARPSAPAPKTPPQPQPKQRLPNRPLPSRRPRPNPHRRFTKAPPTPRHDAELTSMCARRWPKPFSLRPSSSRHPRPARRQANTMTPRRARRQTKSTAARPAPARATLESPPQKESRRKAERRKAIHRITGRRQVISRPPQ